MESQRKHSSPTFASGDYDACKSKTGFKGKSYFKNALSRELIDSLTNKQGQKEQATENKNSKSTATKKPSAYHHASVNGNSPSKSDMDGKSLAHVRGNKSFDSKMGSLQNCLRFLKFDEKEKTQLVPWKPKAINKRPPWNAPERKNSLHNYFSATTIKCNDDSRKLRESSSSPPSTMKTVVQGEDPMPEIKTVSKFTSANRSRARRTFSNPRFSKYLNLTSEKLGDKKKMVPFESIKLWENYTDKSKFHSSSESGDGECDNLSDIEHQALADITQVDHWGKKPESVDESDEMINYYYHNTSNYLSSSESLESDSDTLIDMNREALADIAKINSWDIKHDFHEESIYSYLDRIQSHNSSESTDSDCENLSHLKREALEEISKINSWDKEEDFYQNEKIYHSSFENVGSDSDNMTDTERETLADIRQIKYRDIKQESGDECLASSEEKS